MGILDLFRRQSVNPKNIEERAKIYLGGLQFNNLSSFSNNKAMKLAAFYCGVNQISNSVAMLPIDIVKYDNDESLKIEHPLWRVLNLKPNAKYVPFQMWKAAVEHIIMKGNAFFLIQRDSNLNVSEIIPIENDFVTILPQGDGTVKYSIAGIGTVDAINVLDFAMYRDRVFKGVSLLNYAYNTLDSTSNAESAANKFYKGGAGLSGVLKASATLTDAQKQQIKSSWSEAFSKDGNGIAVIPQGLDFSPISVNPKDAMLIEAREFNVVEIARFLNISPIKLFDLKEVSYSSMEATNLSYIEDTVRPYCEMIADEMNLKLFKPSEVGRVGVKFNFAAAMQTNKQALAEYYRTLLTNGILSVNDIRKELGFPTVAKEEGGDALLCQISYGTLSDIYQGKYLKQNAQEQTVQQDNKISK